MLISGVAPSRGARFWTSWTSDDEARAERFVAVARAILSTSALVTVSLEPTNPAVYAAPARLLLMAYGAFAALALPAVRVRLGIVRDLRPAALAADLSVAILITTLTRGPASPFLAFLMFPILAAACMWGSRETLATTAAAIGGLGVEAVLVGQSTVLSVGLVDGEFDARHAVVRVVYMAMTGVLLAMLADREKQRRVERRTITSILEQVSDGGGLEGTLEAVLGAVLRAFTADRAFLVLKHPATGRALLWHARLVSGAREAFISSSELDDDARDRYVLDVPGVTWHASRIRGGEWLDVCALDIDGNRSRATGLTLPAALSAVCEHSVLGVSLTLDKEWDGRLLLIDPAAGGHRQTALRLAHRLAREIGPAAHQGYLLGTLRAHAATIERARVARELHDGVVQSLIVAEIQVEVLRRTADDAPQVASALRNVQAVLRAEVKNLRELTQRLTCETAPPPLPGLTDLVARFARDSGIDARLVSEPGASAMSRRSRDELSRIVQEGLVNVRKHSGARHVLVRAGASHGQMKLSIEDDGCGFPFSGRLSQSQLAARRQGPRVIMQRVRALGGDLSVESRPGHGARIDVAVPLS